MIEISILHSVSSNALSAPLARRRPLALGCYLNANCESSVWLRSAALLTGPSTARNINVVIMTFITRGRTWSAPLLGVRARACGAGWKKIYCKYQNK